jgi:RNA recognition motif-containing protein
MEKNPQIFITKLDPRITEKDLSHKFGKIGEIKSIRIRGSFAFLVNI